MDIAEEQPDGIDAQGNIPYLSMPLFTCFHMFPAWRFFNFSPLRVLWRLGYIGMVD